MSNIKPKIHFILPGGGFRGAFQAGFMYNLFKKYENTFEIAKIDGTSAGALTGFAIMNNKYDNLKDIWLNINNINDLFSNWSDKYLIGKVSSCIQGFYNNGIFSNNKIKDTLIQNSKNTWESYTDEWKNKYSCAVVNLKTASVEYVDGTNYNIINYITASASPWIITNPVCINDTLYTDGCLLETYPIQNIDKCNADLTVIVGYDQEHIKYIPGENYNILQYLANLIDISRFNSQNNIKTKDLINTSNIISLASPMTLNFTDFSKESIKDGFDIGIDFANTFYDTYIKTFENKN